MKIQKSTRYALYAAIELATHGGRGPVTAGGVADRYGLPPAVMAKVFQRLAQAGLASGTRGVSGGYRLAKTAREITVLEVVQAFERLGADGSEEAPASLPAGERRLRELFDELDQQTRATLASVTLETLVKPKAPLGG